MCDQWNTDGSNKLNFLYNYGHQSAGSSTASVSLKVDVPVRLAFQSTKNNRFIIGLKDNANMLFTTTSSTLSFNLSDDATDLMFHPPIPVVAMIQ